MIFCDKEDPIFQFCSNTEISLKMDGALHGSGRAENHRPEKNRALASFGCFSSVFHTIYFFFHIACFPFHFEGRLLIQSDEPLPCKPRRACQALRPSCLSAYFHPSSLRNTSRWLPDHFCSQRRPCSRFLAHH